MKNWNLAKKDETRYHSFTGEKIEEVNYYIKDEKKELVAIASSYHSEVEQNAKLIESAPELLENFEKAIRLIEYIQKNHGLVHEVTIRDGYKLISKARGA